MWFGAVLLAQPLRLQTRDPLEISRLVHSIDGQRALTSLSRSTE
jgi:hypothetical protein